MKKKTTQLILGTSVLIIWSLIAFRVFDGITGKEQFIEIMENRPVSFTSVIEDSFTIYADYPDPFLIEENGSSIKANLNSSVSKYQSSKKETQEQDISIVNSLIYFGQMTNKKNKVKFALVSISGNELLVKEKEVIKGIRIIKVEAQKIIISYKGKVFPITIQ